MRKYIKREGGNFGRSLKLTVVIKKKHILNFKTNPIESKRVIIILFLFYAV